jgi:hypothetical protein
MKTIIAGGRRYIPCAQDYATLDSLDITTVVSGGASGADQLGEEWAATRGVPLMRFVAEWDKYGKAAGPIRNREMAKYAEAVVLFRGGAGTKNMKQEALKAGLKILHEG